MDYDWGRFRVQGRLPGTLLNFGVYAVSIVAVLWHLYYAYTGAMPRTQHANLHLGALLVVYYLYEMDREPKGWAFLRENLVSIVMVGIFASTMVYVHVHFDRWLTEASPTLTYTTVDLVVGVLVIVAVIHATWKAYGNLLTGVVIAVLFYGYAGFLFPGVFFHTGISAERLVFMNSISLAGVYSFILGVGATWVAVFVFFAGIVEGHGGLDDIIAASKALSEKFESGFVQAAVSASMVMGSIIGSSAANVATTGSFTIPMMQRNGVPGRFAGAIESIASTAGQILPPVMASAAFIMADLLGISFFEVIRAASLPALLFYTTLVFTVVLLVGKYEWTAAPSTPALPEGVPSGASAGNETSATAETGSESPEPIEANIQVRGPIMTPLYYLTWVVPVAVILYVLVVLRYDPMTAGLWAIIVLVGLTFSRDLLQRGISLETLTFTTRNTVEGIKIGVVNMAPLTAVLASLGIVVQIISRTGFTQRFSLSIMALSGGIFLGVVFLVMLSSILFGLGMPTPAAYVVVALLAAPGMVELGVGELNAHMFVLYFAVLSTITPPVAISCAVAAGIAKEDFLDVSFLTIRIGLYAFIIPYAFLFNSSLIYWNGTGTVITFLLVMVGLWGISVGLVGHNLKERINRVKRGLYFLIGATVIFAPEFGVAVAACLLLVGLFWYNKFVVGRIVDRTQPAD